MKKPNILIFMTDQQHAETIGENGLCRTPALNALMKDGISFTHAFTNCPMCTPARATAVTGLHPHQHKLVQNSHSPMALYNRIGPGVDTIGTALQREGYHTVYAGKWHIGETPPVENGFDLELKLVPGPKKNEAQISDSVIIKDRFGEHVMSGTADYPAERTGVFRLTSKVNEWLDGRKQDDPPFLLFASCTEPHVPWIVPEPYASMYDPTEMEEWSNYRDDYRDKPHTFSKHYNDVNYCRIRNDWPTMAKALAKYYGCVSMVDAAFGSMISKLEQKGLLDDTIVVFTSDHGELMGRHALIGKNELALDDIIRVPLVVYWKNHFSAGVRDQFVTLGDLYNTVMELAGAQKNQELDSISFMPCLQDEAAEYGERQEVVIEHHGATVHMNTMRAIRDRRYKFVYRPHEIDEFYDMENDPGEMNNLIGSPDYHEQIWEMRKRLLDWAKRTNDFALTGMNRSFANPEAVEFRTR